MATSPSIPPIPIPSPSSHETLSLSQPKPTQRTQSIRSRLSSLCQQGHPHLARQLFDAIQRPTTVLWNTIIIGFICNGFPDEALRCQSGPSKIVYNSLLNMYSSCLESSRGLDDRGKGDVVDVKWL